MDAVSQLREWREPAKAASVQSKRVLDIFLQNESQIRSAVAKDEYYQILEQAFIAACDCHQLRDAFRLISILRERFPDSHRVDRLLTLLFEAQGNEKGALEGYDALTEEDPLDTVSRKRQVVLALNQQSGSSARQQAIAMLVDYIVQFQADQEAWLMLANLYTLEWKLAYAAYCLEEVILHAPDNRHAICRYAETKASCAHSDLQHLFVARKYFLYANRLCPKWTRPLFGVVYCCVRLRRIDSAADDIFAWAKQKIEELVEDTKFDKTVKGFLHSCT